MLIKRRTASAGGRLSFVAGAIVVGLALTGCDSGRGDDDTADATDAVAVSTTRPPSTSSDGDDDRNTSTPTGSGAATTSGGYSATSLPSLDGLILEITEPLVDGRYMSSVPTVSRDGSTIAFELLDCPEIYGTVQDSCLDFVDFERSSTTTSLRVGTGTASVLLVDGVSEPEPYRVTTEELARLLAGEPPAADAPEGFVFDIFDGFVVTVRDGAVTSAEQMWLS